MNDIAGKLIGVGLGPGDPELLTVKAARIIAEADVVAYPAANDGASLARRIASRYIPDKKEEFPYSLPMRSDRAPAQAAYDAAADALEGKLLQGQTIALICEGDPLFFGSFMYLAARLSPKYRVEVVPGVTSVSAAAAASSGSPAASP